MSDRATAELIADDIVAGLSLRQVGAKRGMTYENARLIVAAHPDLARRVKDARAARRGRTPDPSVEAARRAESDRRRSLPREETSRRYSDHDLEEIFHEFLTFCDGEPASSRAFTTWLSDREGPSHMTFMARFGPSWGDVCARFGATAVGGRGRAISRDVCATAVRRVRDAVGHPPTAAQYEDLKAPGDPSRSVVQNRVGSGRWSGVTAFLIGDA